VRSRTRHTAPSCMRRLLLFAIFGLAALVGCDTAALETESQVVVEAYLGGFEDA